VADRIGETSPIQASRPGGRRSGPWIWARIRPPPRRRSAQKPSSDLTAFRPSIPLLQMDVRIPPTTDED